MELAELENLIKTRRSIRRWQQKDVPLEMITRAIELATWAPNAGNRQPYAFYIVQDRKLINGIADAVLAKTELVASWPEARDFATDVARWKETSAFFRGAPVCIAVLMGKYESTADLILKKHGPDPAAQEIAEARRLGSSSLQSAAATIAYLLLVLHQMGLGAVWMAGPLQAKKEIETMLGVPPDLHFVALIPVGYPAESPDPRLRRPVDEVVKVFLNTK